MKNILITGGVGYIGGRIATYLKEKMPVSNIILTNRDNNVPCWTNAFRVVKMDILDNDSINSYFNGIDIIIHLAAMNEIDSMREPDFALDVNAKGTYNLLNAARTHNIKKFIYLSTIHVYGHLSLWPVITEETPNRPFHPYAITHLAAEGYVDYFRHYYGIDTLILRLSNGYGYPVDINIKRWTLVFNDLCRQVVTTGKILLNSSGRQHRDFISLRDIAGAIYHFIDIIPDNWGDGLYNLGGECSMSILDVANKISSIYKLRYKLTIPEIKINNYDVSQSNETPVNYSIKKLKATGFTLTSDMSYEIERTMSLCEMFT
ncbi:UDP-glucose 4-epimerase [Candidatus Magnetobacterium bavaricum]|uniref:UDP-glucose 4-epimerase n=1 Tax=Candidatus Magnetobacterium bavaricum TaxID=29290 RepID=A0A0F3GN30_9BACT|nr:UDP-glucose 4-epimerase [Candidatus Magnetobacterium bavaricum]